ncbi:cyanophycin synthetase [Psychromonas arctica]|uniref:cyanophycin synthetase n=1 Tax=Psychromonas arctica TaxID=168275 RepID=UPI002FD22B79
MNIKKIIYAWISKKFMGGCSNYNSLEVRRSCRSKEQARDRFKQGNIPHAQGMIFFNPFTAIRFAKQHGFPLVIKPNVSGFSRGSHFPIRDYKALWKAIFLAKLWWPFTVVEQFLEGKNYRVVVANGKIVSVLQRYAPSVKGDGTSTIRELMNKENAIREKMKLYPVISPLKETAQSRAFLAKQGLNFDSILEADQRATLFYRISLAPGGVVEVINKQLLPEANETLFKNVLTLFDANILGIDVILEKGIEFDYRDQQCIFLEVNSRPYLKMHAYPRYGEAEDLSDYFDELDALEVKQSDTF